MEEIKGLYELCKKHDASYELYEALKIYRDNLISNTIGKVMADNYENYRRLSNSINNAGHEKRRSDDIKFINDVMTNISNKYEDYLC